MVIAPDIEAQILRYHPEKWTVGTIARQLHVHHSVVRRVLAQAGLPRIGPPPRPSQIDAYLPFIRQTLETFPTLTASRLYAMARERGYGGSPDHFRHLIACHRPRPTAEAYLRLRSLPGEQAQVDWAHFGPLQIGRARRPLMAFVMVLSYSRQIFLRFFLGAQMESFLRGHVGAFAAWRSPAATRRAASSAPSATSGIPSSRPAASLIWMTSMPRPRPGALAPPPTGAAPTSRRAPSARCSRRKRAACWRCPTIPRRCSSGSRSARAPMSAST